MAGYKIYIGDGSNNYFKYNGTNVLISTSGADALTIKSGGDIKVESGGDIKLLSATGGNTALLSFTGHWRTGYMGMDYDQDYMVLFNDTDGYGKFVIGYNPADTVKRWNAFEVYTGGTTVNPRIYMISSYNANQYGELSMQSASNGVVITLNSNDTWNGNCLISMAGGDMDLNAAGNVTLKHGTSASDYVACSSTLHGTGKIWHFQDTAMADEEYVELPDAVHGFVMLTGKVNGGSQFRAVFWIHDDGTVATASGLYSSNVSANPTPPDGYICLYDVGTNARLYNRAGTTIDIVCWFFYG